MKSIYHLRSWVSAATAAFLFCLPSVSAAIEPAEGTVPRIATTGADESDAGKKRSVRFSNVSLRHMADHFATVSGRKISVATEIAALKIGGKVEVADVDSFLRMLPRVLPVRVESLKDGSVQILPKETLK